MEKYDTVDGSEMRRFHQLRERSFYLPLFTTGFMHPRWLFRISEPSTVCMNIFI